MTKDGNDETNRHNLGEPTRPAGSMNAGSGGSGSAH